MQAEVGQILSGKVTGITKFGVFVDLENGLTGMVHISEVSDTFVKEIADFVKLGDEVKVKILSIGEDKKISLSMKQANPDFGKPKPKKEFRPRKPADDNRSGESYVWTPRKDELSFEEMMSKFKQSSEEKMSDLKRVMDGKKGSRRGR
ncbi:MAG: S1 RNA-binding domain-containing protein [Oscillospiraceae bacterium]|nr:S1 RNA-binding domain-containing protein [Oscillospiraceae bacterium]